MSRAMRRALASVFSLGAVCALAIVAFSLLAGRERSVRRPMSPGVAPIGVSEKFAGSDPIEHDGFATAALFTGPIHDSTSLRELRDAVAVRGSLGIAVLKAEIDGRTLGFRAPREEIAEAVRLRHQLGLLNLYEGQFAEAVLWFRKAQELGSTRDVPARDRAQRHVLLGLAALKLGKLENRATASREAIEQFTTYLAENPDDLGVRWFLNLAYMALDAYPAQVPPRFLIAQDTFRSKLDVGPFEEIAQRVGPSSRGPSLAGGSVFDDLNGDGFPDLFITSLDTRKGAALYINRGDGTLIDRSKWAGLDDQVYALNVTRADIDNDGDLDLLLLRGGGEIPFRPSLLRNKGDGAFEDVTVKSGLGEPISSGSAAWGDFDNDGWVDVFVCGEGGPAQATRARAISTAAKCSRLYRNRGDGTFDDVAAQAGVSNECEAKGAAWGDYDDDGRLDLFISNFDAACRLYHNLGDGTFVDAALEAGVAGPAHNRSTFCWFWDFDNDGRLDLFVNDAHASLADVAASYLGRKVDDAGRPRVYRNIGNGGFRELSRELGLDRPVLAFGANFGDIDNDGYLDIYLASGGPSTLGPMPGLLLKNIDGRRFEDVTDSGHKGPFDKGAGVSFADWDSDGNIDFFVNPGGMVSGDRSFPRLFKNPGHGRHWFKVKLIGTRTNRSALGAKIRVDFASADGRSRSIFRCVGNNSSFGGNSLVESVGLSEATDIAKVTVFWPKSRTRQEFANVASDQEIEITEGADTFKVRRQTRPTSASP